MNYRKLIVLPLALLLVGCTSQTQDRQSAASQSTTITSKASDNNSKQSKSKTANQSDSSTKAQSSRSTTAGQSKAAGTSSSTSASNSTAVSRLTTLNQQLIKALGSQILVPQKDGLASGSAKLNMRYQGDSQNYTVKYSVGQQTKPFNDTAVADETAYATVTKTTYSSANTAAKQVGYRDNKSVAGLPTVALGHQITAHIDSGAGQRYIIWNEGRWSLTVHTNMMHNDAGIALAKQAVTTFETVYLPAPQSVGAIAFEAVSSGGLDQLIQWQSGKVVYKVSARDTTTAIKMAASMQQ